MTTIPSSPTTTVTTVTTRAPGAARSRVPRTVPPRTTGAAGLPPTTGAARTTPTTTAPLKAAGDDFQLAVDGDDPKAAATTATAITTTVGPAATGTAAAAAAAIGVSTVIAATCTTTAAAACAMLPDPTGTALGRLPAPIVDAPTGCTSLPTGTIDDPTRLTGPAPSTGPDAWPTGTVASAPVMGVATTGAALGIALAQRTTARAPDTGTAAVHGPAGTPGTGGSPKAARPLGRIAAPTSTGIVTGPTVAHAIAPATTRRRGLSAGVNTPAARRTVGSVTLTKKDSTESQLGALCQDQLARLARLVGPAPLELEIRDAGDQV